MRAIIRSRSVRLVVGAAALAIAAASPPAAAQGPDPTERTPRAFLAPAFGATLGSAIGGFAGAYIAVNAGASCCQVDDGWPNPAILAFGALAGSVGGSWYGAYVAGGRPWHQVLIGSVLGMGVGLLAGAAADDHFGTGGAVIAYTVGQGLTTALFSLHPY